MPEKLFLTIVEKLFESNLGPIFTTFSDVLQNITQKLEQITILKKCVTFLKIEIGSLTSAYSMTRKGHLVGSGV